MVTHSDLDFIHLQPHNSMISVTYCSAKLLYSIFYQQKINYSDNHQRCLMLVLQYYIKHQAKNTQIIITMTMTIKFNLFRH